MKLLLENWKRFLNDLKIDCELDGICIDSATEIAKKLLSDGKRDFKVIEGYVWTVNGSDDDYPTEHTWIETGDGKIIDPSGVQFDKYGGIEERIKGTAYDQSGEHYGESKIYTPEEYLEMPR
jgi:hypothetical protein